MFALTRRTTLLISLFAMGLLACARLPAADPSRDALQAAIERWVTAVNARDVAAMNATMTAEVELLDSNGATEKGREAAVKALRALATNGKLASTTREIDVQGDLAWHVAALALTEKNGVVHSRGQALEIWKRVDGKWKLHRRMTGGVPGDLLSRPPTNEPILDTPKN